MKGKKIEIKDITSSPFFVIGLLCLVCVLIVVGIVFIMLDVDSTKKDIVEERQMYIDNVNQVALLEELKVKSEQAEEQLEACEDILPQNLGDVFVLEENVINKCRQFGLDVTSIEQTIAVNETQEVVFTISVNAPYRNINNYMNYYSNLEQVHRFDSLTLTDVGDGNYSATFSLAFLAEEGAEGAIGAVVDGAVSELAEVTSAS